MSIKKIFRGNIPISRILFNGVEVWHSREAPISKYTILPPHIIELCLKHVTDNNLSNTTFKPIIHNVESIINCRIQGSPHTIQIISETRDAKELCINISDSYLSEIHTYSGQHTRDVLLDVSQDADYIRGIASIGNEDNHVNIQVNFPSGLSPAWAIPSAIGNHSRNYEFQLTKVLSMLAAIAALSNYVVDYDVHILHNTMFGIGEAAIGEYFSHIYAHSKRTASMLCASHSYAHHDAGCSLDVTYNASSKTYILTEASHDCKSNISQLYRHCGSIASPNDCYSRSNETLHSDWQHYMNVYDSVIFTTFLNAIINVSTNNKLSMLSPCVFNSIDTNHLHFVVDENISTGNIVSMSSDVIIAVETVCEANIAESPGYVYPVQTENDLYIKQIYSATRNGTDLYIGAAI